MNWKTILDLESDFRDAYDGHATIDLSEVDPDVWLQFAPRYDAMVYYVPEEKRRRNRSLPDHLKSSEAKALRAGVVRLNAG